MIPKSLLSHQGKKIANEGRHEGFPIPYPVYDQDKLLSN
jgi:hypothetical protein